MLTFLEFEIPVKFQSKINYDVILHRHFDRHFTSIPYFFPATRYCSTSLPFIPLRSFWGPIGVSRSLSWRIFLDIPPVLARLAALSRSELFPPHRTVSAAAICGIAQAAGADPSRHRPRLDLAPDPSCGRPAGSGPWRHPPAISRLTGSGVPWSIDSCHD
jgi:hypothetical protein